MKAMRPVFEMVLHKWHSPVSTTTPRNLLFSLFFLSLRLSGRSRYGPTVLFAPIRRRARLAVLTFLFGRESSPARHIFVGFETSEPSARVLHRRRDQAMGWDRNEALSRQSRFRLSTISAPTRSRSARGATAPHVSESPRAKDLGNASDQERSSRNAIASDNSLSRPRSGRSRWI